MFTHKCHAPRCHTPFEIFLPIFAGSQCELPCKIWRSHLEKWLSYDRLPCPAQNPACESVSQWVSDEPRYRAVFTANKRTSIWKHDLNLKAEPKIAASIYSLHKNWFKPSRALEDDRFSFYTRFNKRFETNFENGENIDSIKMNYFSIYIVMRS